VQDNSVNLLSQWVDTVIKECTNHQVFKYLQFQEGSADFGDDDLTNFTDPNNYTTEKDRVSSLSYRPYKNSKESRQDHIRRVAPFIISIVAAFSDKRKPPSEWKTTIALIKPRNTSSIWKCARAGGDGITNSLNFKDRVTQHSLGYDHWWITSFFLIVFKAIINCVSCCVPCQNDSHTDSSSFAR